MKIYTYENDFQQFVKDNDGSRVLRIDEEMFFYWLEVLPPVYTHEPVKIAFPEGDSIIICSFGFAEGRETVTDFWRSEDKDGNEVYYCKRSIRLNRG
jgi:hypothetical protein